VGFLLIVILFFGAIWFLFLVPARRRKNAHQAMQDAVDLGDDVITAGGLHGKVTALEDETVRLEIAPSVVVTLDRRAIAAVATEVEVELEAESEEDEDREDSDAAPETPAEPR
jgi:preprotein translocase subunit YajC